MWCVTFPVRKCKGVRGVAFHCIVVKRGHDYLEDHSVLSSGEFLFGSKGGKQSVVGMEE